jgi:hypothetical protein
MCYIVAAICFIVTCSAKVAENRQQVDAQRLRLDNLLYEQAHLTREIKRCKDLKTPEVQLVEAEIAEKLTANRFTDELPMINTTALQTLSEEQSARKAMQTELEEVDKTKSNLNQAIEEKMKFLSQLPAHLTAVEQVLISGSNLILLVRRIVLNKRFMFR